MSIFYSTTSTVSDSKNSQIITKFTYKLHKQNKPQACIKGQSPLRFKLYLKMLLQLRSEHFQSEFGFSR
jgi:hypothetical protein